METRANKIKLIFRSQRKILPHFSYSKLWHVHFPWGDWPSWNV